MTSEFQTLKQVIAQWNTLHKASTRPHILTTLEALEAVDTNLAFSVDDKAVLLGKGGNGQVHEGWQPELQRLIAIKRLVDQSTSSPSSPNPLLSEALTSAYLEHPGITPIYSIKKIDEDLAIGMKRLHGQTWDKLISNRPGEDQSQVGAWINDQLEILKSVCNAVAFAHDHDLAHCDLKPSNVHVGEYGEVVVLDWGAAVDFRDNADPKSSLVPYRAVHKSDVKTHIGTPQYLPPELALGRGESIGPSTDVFLLGSILFEILTGRPPYCGRSRKYIRL